MQKTDWTEVKKRLKKAINQGMKILKEGTDEAGYLARQTAHAIQLEMDIHGLRGRIATLSHRLGNEAHRGMKNGRLHVTNEMKNINGEMNSIEVELRRKENELHHISVIRRKGEPRRAARPHK